MSQLRGFVFVVFVLFAFGVKANSFIVNTAEQQQDIVYMGPGAGAYLGAEFIGPNLISTFGQASNALNDNWVLTVGAGEIVSIDFTSSNLPSFGISIADFSVTNTNALGQGTFATGVHNFNVTGMLNLIGGAYSVKTNVVSSVPLPAAAWLMGSALVGLVSFGRRKTNPLAA